MTFISKSCCKFPFSQFAFDCRLFSYVLSVVVMQVMVVSTAKVSRQYRLELLWHQFVYEKERLVGCDLISLLKYK